MDNNTKTPFLTFSAAMNTQGEPVALHVEGNLSRKPEYREGTDGKKSFASFSMGIGRNPYALLGSEEAAAHPDEPTFVSVIVFSPEAEFVRDNLDKGSKVAVCGKVQKRTFTRKDGTEGEAVQIIASGIRALSCRQTAGSQPDDRVAHTTITYPKRDGTTGTSQLALLVTGTVKSAGQVREVANNKVRDFKLEMPIEATKLEAIVSGKFSKDADYGNYKQMNCTVWGPRAEHLDKVLTVGNTLAISGIPTIREYNGNTYVNFRVRDISVMNWNNAAPAQNSASASSASASVPAAAATPALDDGAYDVGGDFGDLMDGMDDELPF